MTKADKPRDPEWGKKLQDENQVKGRYGELLAAFAFPPHWVVRPIPDDYGLDLELEVFHEATQRANGVRRYQTRGEHLYMQVKTTDSLDTQVLGCANSVDLPVATFQMSTSDLKLIDLMGASVPVVLLLVDRSENKIYYVCLTDYISHYLNAENPTWREQVSTKIYVPQRNQLTTSGQANELREHWNYFFRLARRSKLYSAFNLISYYKNELGYALPHGGFDGPEPTEKFFSAAISFVTRFSEYIGEICRLDIWPTTDGLDWAALHDGAKDLASIQSWCIEMFHTLTTRDGGDVAKLAELAVLFERKAEREIHRLGTVAALSRSYESVGRLERLPCTDPFNPSDTDTITSPSSVWPNRSN